MIVGFTDKIAWGATALNADYADLFQEKVNPDDPDQYLWKGKWRDFEKRTETIRVKNGDPVVLQVRSTIHGPVGSDLIESCLPGEIYTLKTGFREPESSSVGAMLQMMRAHDWESFRKPMVQYYQPSLHIVFADADGNIGYQSLVKLPRRPTDMPLPRCGWSGEDEWEPLPFEFMPNMLNPKQDYISTANGLPVGSWHPFSVCVGLGGGPRSWRLREIFAANKIFSVRSFIEKVHKDTVTTVVRDFRTLVVALVQEQGAPNDDVARAAEILKNWNGQMRTDAPGYPLAAGVLEVIQESVGADWIMGYGGNWAGMTAIFRAIGPGETDARLTEFFTNRLGLQDVETTVRLLTSMLLAHRASILAGMERPSDRQIEEHARKATDFFLQAITTSRVDSNKDAEDFAPHSAQSGCP